MNASDPPRILTRTSPGPACPRVATVSTPMEPIRELSPATVSFSSHRPGGESHPIGRNAGRPTVHEPATISKPAMSPGDRPGSLTPARADARLEISAGYSRPDL